MKRLPTSKTLLLLAFALGCAWLAVPAAADDGSMFGKGALSEQPEKPLKPAPDKPDVDDDTDETPAPATDLATAVSAVELGGIERVDKQTVLNQLHVKAGQPLDPQAVAEDVRRVWAMGLFDDVRVGLRQAGPRTVIVHYQVLERPSIAGVEVRGNAAQSDEDVLKVVDLRVNNLYSAADAQANVQKIKDMYAEEGYFLATVTHHVEPQPGNQVKVVFDVQERSEVKVRHIELLGNEGVTDADIKTVLRTQEGSILSAISKSGNFKRELLDYDAQIMQYLYLTRGYIQAKIEDPVVSLSPDMKYITVTIRIHEGPQFRVGKVTVIGESVVPIEDLQKALTLKSGDIFNYANVQADGQKLAGAQKNFGFAHATVSNESVPDMEAKTVDWTYHVQKGKKVYFGQIVMQGGTSTRDKVIRRELQISEGELYSEQKLELSKARVQRLGFFERVDIKTRPTALPQVLDVVVDVKERTTGTFQVGMGFSSVDNFITTAQIAKDNFLGRGQRFSIQGSLSSIRTMFQGSFFEPHFLDTNTTFSIDLFRYDQLYTDFTRRSKGGSITWGYWLTDTLLADAGYSLEQATVVPGGLTGRQDVPIASLFSSGITSSLRGTLTYDSRDDRMFPTTGWYASGTAEWALPQLGSEVALRRFTARIRRYFPLPFDSVLRFNLVGGLVQSTDGKQIPLFQRYFMGGIYTVRGFQLNTLGPAIAVPASTDPASSLSAFHEGGIRQIYLNNEIEIPILKAPMNLRGLLFFDVGNAFGEGQPVSFAGTRQSFGWGIRWFSPVGPLRFEWGVPLNPRVGEQPLVFEFTIGNSF
jgi:outer membrane protein insertion porin family